MHILLKNIHFTNEEKKLGFREVNLLDQVKDRGRALV
jgi:hypothetical protein